MSNHLGWQQLDTCRDNFRLCLLFKILHNQTCLWLSDYILSPPQQQNPLEVPMQIMFLFHLPRPTHTIIRLVLKFVKIWLSHMKKLLSLNNLRTLLINCNCVSVWSPPPVFSLHLQSWHSNKIIQFYSMYWHTYIYVRKIISSTCDWLTRSLRLVLFTSGDIKAIDITNNE